MSSPYSTFSYYTFGCKVNFADTCTISRQLIDKGLSEVRIDDKADIYMQEMDFRCNHLENYLPCKAELCDLLQLQIPKASQPQIAVLLVC